jgi:nucleoid-associated protein YgaU
VAVADDRGRCPVCEADLTPIVSWRVHAATLYNRGLEASSKGQWHVAAVLLEQARVAAPNAANAALLLGKVYARLGRVEEARAALDDALRLGASQASVRPALDGLAHVNRVTVPWRLAAGLAALVLVAVALSAGAYRLGLSGQPSPRVVAVQVTVLVAAASPTPVPTASEAAGTPSPAPTPTPSPTAVLCPGLAGQVAARWAAVPALAMADLLAQSDGCSVRIGGSAPTAHLVDVAVAAARAAGASQTDVTGVAVTQRYVVQAGDTLWSIADALYGDPSRYVDIISANAGLPSDARQLQTGQVLAIPPLATS